MTQFFNASPSVDLVLTRNLIRSLKRGHPWVYAQAVQDLPEAPSGSYAILRDKKGRKLASGYYDPSSPIVFRVCSLTDFNPKHSRHVERALARCHSHRSCCVGGDTNAYRLINGEGDGLPGVVCDVYDRTAVLAFDGQGADRFWNNQALADWLVDNLQVETVVVKARRKGGARAPEPTPTGLTILAGVLPQDVVIRENGVEFTVDISRGQKTGFFLDQRNNRQAIRQVSRDRSVLNLFGYTGGFSVYAGLGGARHVTTVDLSRPAIEASRINWELNGLEPAKHEGLAADVFEYIEANQAKPDPWDVIIVDPPSFASSEENVPQATKAYGKLIGGACGLLRDGGLLAASSCSSHIDSELFLTICEEAVASARRRARVVWIGGQPADHPFPIAAREFRYLKFVLLEVFR